MWYDLSVRQSTCARESCGEIIPAERVQNAKQRGYVAKWCSAACSSAGNAAAYYERMRPIIAARRAKARKES